MKKVSKQKSLVFLFALKGALSRGLSLEVGIDMLAKIQPKPLNKYLNQIMFLVKNKNKKIFVLLEQYGFITKEEQIIFEKAKDTKMAINKVLEMRKIQNRFSTLFLKMFAFPFIAFIATPILVYVLLGKFDVVLSQLFLLLKNKGITPTFYDLGLPSAYYFVWDRQILIYISVTAAVTAFIFYNIFFYLKRYKPQILYKLLSPVAYDDLPYLLSYMAALNKVGYPMRKVVNILAQSNLKPGWTMFFKDLEKKVQSGQKIYLSFQKENFPKEIVTYVKYDELNGDFWGNIESLKELAVMRNKEISSLFEMQIKPYVTLIGWAVVIYFISGLMLFSFAVNNLASLLQG